MTDLRDQVEAQHRQWAEQHSEALTDRIAELEAQNAALMTERDAISRANVGDSDWLAAKISQVAGCQRGSVRTKKLVDFIQSILASADTTAFNRGLEEAAKAVDAIARKAHSEVHSFDSYGGASLPGREREAWRADAADDITAAIRALKSDSKENTDG